MSERLNSHNKVKKSVATTIALGASVLALTLTGCVYDYESDKESGSTSIEMCPKGYVQSGDIQVTSPKKFNIVLSKAVNQLASSMPRNIMGNTPVVMTELTPKEQSLHEAGKNVFYNESGTVTVQDETKIDDLSEQLCSGPDGKVYQSPNAVQVIGAMENAGINVASIKK